MNSNRGGVFGERSLKCSFQRAGLLGDFSGSAESHHGGFRERSDPSISAFEREYRNFQTNARFEGSGGSASTHITEKFTMEVF